MRVLDHMCQVLGRICRDFSEFALLTLAAVVVLVLIGFLLLQFTTLDEGVVEVDHDPFDAKTWAMGEEYERGTMLRTINAGNVITKGMAKQEAHALLGEPDAIEADRWLWRVKAVGYEGEALDLALIVRFRDDMVVDYSIGR